MDDSNQSFSKKRKYSSLSLFASPEERLRCKRLKVMLCPFKLEYAAAVTFCGCTYVVKNKVLCDKVVFVQKRGEDCKMDALIFFSIDRLPAIFWLLYIRAM